MIAATCAFSLFLVSSRLNEDDESPLEAMNDLSVPEGYNNIKFEEVGLVRILCDNLSSYLSYGVVMIAIIFPSSFIAIHLKDKMKV